MRTESDEPQRLQINFTPEFKRKLGLLAKRYCNIRSDLLSVINQLLAIYSKSDQQDMALAEIRNILEDFYREN